MKGQLPPNSLQKSEKIKSHSREIGLNKGIEDAKKNKM